MRPLVGVGVAALVSTFACGGPASDTRDDTAGAIAVGAESRVAFAPGHYFGPTAELQVVKANGAILEVALRLTKSGRLIEGTSAGVVAGTRKWLKAGIQTERLGEGCEMMNIEDEKGPILRVYGMPGVCPFAGALARQR